MWYWTLTRATRGCVRPRSLFRPRFPLQLASVHVMLNGVVHYLQERKSGLQKAAGYVGGAYLVGQYVLGRLEDVRTTVMQDRFARDK